jgi:hypothetical protein
LKHEQTNTHDHHVNDSSSFQQIDERGRERESPHHPSPKIKIKIKIPLPTYLPTYLSTYLPTQELCIQDMVKILPSSSCRNHHYLHNKLQNAEKMFDFAQQKQSC